MHIVLLGDSIFDNAPYTDGGPAVIDHLRSGLQLGEEATLLAVDGHCVSDVQSQLRKVPNGASHFFLSIGGNDALDHVELLNRRVETAGQGLALMGRPVETFAEEYSTLLGHLREELPWLQVCTVYNGNFGPEAPILTAAIRLFNDAIQRAANERGVPVVELRSLLNRPEHYANPIEPSVEGGRVLAAELLRRAGGS
ncbi:MAG: SGNH/GDSL hydrolase family protein [Gemmatimonadetes bacterium]|nr:SGNH/GDSL hydrolase family protein [Gemmatimonadota bacterium]